MTLPPDTPTLLIVDDTPGNLSVLVSLFEESGYRVAIAQDGEEGLQRAGLVQPDLILLDVMLPGADGFEVCRQLKAQESTRDIPVIFMTALASVEHKLKGFQAGGVDYVTKPLQFEEVIARVSTQINLGAMRKRLEAQNAELQRYREQLEERVAERTAELNRSNQRLRLEIAEREKAQEELAAKEREFRTLAENLPDNLARYDKTCRIQYMNPVLEATLGTSLDDRQGLTPLEASPGTQYAEYQVLLEKTIATGCAQEMELVFPETDEGPRIHHIRFVPEYDVHGNIQGALAIGRDVTRQRRMENELRAREQYQRALLDNFPFMVWLKDTEGRLLAINRPYLDTAGLPPDTPYFGKTDLDLFPREQAEQYRADDRDVMESRRQKTVEELVGQPGNLRWHETWKSPVFDQSGQLLGTVGFARDITERKEAERLLHEQDQAIRAVVENSPDIIIRYDTQLRRIYINPAMQKIFGLPTDKLIGISPRDEAPVPLQKEYIQRLEAVLASGQERRLEMPFKDAQGQAQWTDLRFVPEFGPDGKVISVLMVGHDITERKEAERLLHEQDQAIRAMVENSPDIIARYDTQGRRIYVNSAMQRVFGLSIDAIMGKTPLEISAMTDAAAYVQQIHQVLASGQEARMEISFRNGDNKLHWGDMRLVPEFGPDGNVTSVLTIMRDITARKQVENLLREERGLFVGGPTVVFKWRAEEGWPVEYVSPNVQEQFGYAAGDLISGKVIFASIVHPDDIARVANEVATYTAQGWASYEQVYRIAHGNGGYRWIYDFTIVSRREDGSAAHYHGYVMDITAQKLAENALKESEQRYRLVFENSPVSIWEEDFSEVRKFFDELRQAGVSDIETYFGQHPEAVHQCVALAKIVDVNQAAVALHNATDKNELFAGLLNTFTPESFETFRQELICLWNGGTVMAQDAIVKTLKGEPRHVTVHFTVCPGYENSLSRVLVSLADITERKLAENALKESEQRFRQIFDNVSDSLYLIEVTPEGRFRNLEVNPAFEASSGIARTDLVGKFIDETVPEGTSSIIAAKYRRCVADGVPMEEEVVLDLPRGRRHYHSTLIPVRDATGRVHRIVGISRDITDRERARELLLRQIELDRRLARFAELAPGFMYTYRQDSSGKDQFLYASPGIETLCGLRVEQLLEDAAVFFEHMPPEESARIFAALDNAAREAKTCVIEYRTVHPERGEQWLELRATPEREPDGSLLWHGHLVDVTARRAMEFENALLRAMADNAVDPLIFTHSLDASQGLPLFYSNPAFARHLGRTPEEMRHLTVLDFTGYTREELAHHMDVLRKEKSLRFETEQIRKDGEHVPVEVTLSYLEHNGEEFAAGYCMDITRRKEDEQRLMESRAQLRELAARREAVRDQERKHIAREMHDELGQDLTALRLEISLLPLQFGPELEERAEVLAGRVDKTLRSVRSMISMLRPPALDMGLVPALDWLVSEFGNYTGIHSALSANEAEIELDDARAVLVFRIVQEFLTNVVRHAGASNVRIALEKKDGGYLLTAQDDGKGFDPAAIRKKSFGLLGMRERAIMLEGCLEIISAPGQGTRLELSFSSTGEVKGEQDD